MKSDRITVWKFDDAPAKLQRMHVTATRPTWVAFIPQTIYAADVDEAIGRRWAREGVFRYETSSGDVVYMGCVALKQFVETVGANRPKDSASVERPR